MILDHGKENVALVNNFFARWKRLCLLIFWLSEKSRRPNLPRMVWRTYGTPDCKQTFWFVAQRLHSNKDQERNWGFLHPSRLRLYLYTYISIFRIDPICSRCRALILSPMFAWWSKFASPPFESKFLVTMIAAQFRIQTKPQSCHLSQVPWIFKKSEINLTLQNRNFWQIHETFSKVFLCNNWFLGRIHVFV
jgi:hypothetical protein